jgi:hypothetical protein
MSMPSTLTSRLALTRKLQPAAICILALAAPLLAQTSRLYRDAGSWVEERTGSIPASKALRVITQAGSVQVIGGPQREITYTVKKRAYVQSEAEAQKYLNSFHFRAASSLEEALIEGNWTHPAPRKFSAEILVQVPRELELVRVRTKGGDLSVRNLAARLEAQSGGGNVQVADITGPISAVTSGGSVEVSNVPRELTLRTGGGAIRIHGQTGRINAETAGGNILVASSQGAQLLTGGGSIQVSQCGSQLKASTSGGSIEVGHVKGSAVLETGGGNIRVGGAGGTVVATTGSGSIELFRLMEGVRAQTSAGPIRAELVGAAMKDSVLQSALGDIIVYLAPQTRFTVQATIQMANGHRIRSDFPELRVQSEGGDWGPRNIYAEGALNGGGPVLKVSTVSGNIEFRRTSQ